MRDQLTGIWFVLVAIFGWQVLGPLDAPFNWLVVGIVTALSLFAVARGESGA